MVSHEHPIRYRGLCKVGNKIDEVKKSFKRADGSIEAIHPKIEAFVGGTCIGNFFEGVY